MIVCRWVVDAERTAVAAVVVVVFVIDVIGVDGYRPSHKMITSEKSPRSQPTTLVTDRRLLCLRVCVLANVPFRRSVTPAELAAGDGTGGEMGKEVVVNWWWWCWWCWLWLRWWPGTLNRKKRNTCVSRPLAAG